jgi:hypothetical protein
MAGWNEENKRLACHKISAGMAFFIRSAKKYWTINEVQNEGNSL